MDSYFTPDDIYFTPDDIYFVTQTVPTLALSYFP